MDLTPNQDQETFQTATAEWCRDNMPLEQARNRPDDLWQQLGDMGWLSMTSPEDAGGLALDHSTEALIFAELGRVLAPIAMLSTAVAARWAGPGKYALALPGEGKLRLFDTENADAALGIWPAGAGTLTLEGDLSAKASLDQTASLAAADIALKPSAINDPRAALHLQLLGAAYAVGCADAARDMAAEYAKIREQFGRPIGWFQALKHMCSDMAMRCAVARSQLYFAACALDCDDPDSAFHIASAKRLADHAALENSRTNVQVHGGIGMTDEAYPHYCLKRAHLLGFIAPASQEILLGQAA